MRSDDPAETPSIRNCHPFEMACHSKWLRNNGWVGWLGGLGPSAPLCHGSQGHPISRSGKIAAWEIGGGANIVGACRRVGGYARSVESDPKMIPKWSQHDPTMIPKRFQNDPKLIPKWYQNDLKMIRKWYQNDPKMILKWSQNDTKMIQKWS